MRILLLLAVLLVAPAFANTAYAAKEDGIAVVVNDDVITSSNVKDRMKLIMASSGLPDNEEMRARILRQVIGVLVEETLKLQEASKLGISVSPQDIDKAFTAIASQNNMTPEQFKMVLDRSGIPPRALNDQIKAQIAWSLVVQNKIRPRVFVTEKDVEDRLGRLQQSKGKTEYLISEIFLPIEKAQEQEIKNLADKLSSEIRSGHAPFEAVARQFSRAAGAPQGGDLGWIQADQLPSETGGAIAAMKEGETSSPIRSPSGYHIYALRKKRLITDETLPPKDFLLNQIGMERLDRMQQRYLLDLKSAAFIETRV